MGHEVVMSKRILHIHTVMHLNGQRIQLVRDFATLEEARREMDTLFSQLSTVEDCMGSLTRPSRFKRLLGRFL